MLNVYRHAFAQLPPRDQRLLSMLMCDPPRSYREISATLGLGTSAAKHSVFRAVKKLRLALAPLRSQES